MKKPENMTFEEALTALESTVSELRSPDVSLEDSMKGFEDGMKYYNRCEELLNEAKGKVELYRKETETFEEMES